MYIYIYIYIYTHVWSHTALLGDMATATTRVFAQALIFRTCSTFGSSSRHHDQGTIAVPCGHIACHECPTCHVSYWHFCAKAYCIPD